MIRNETFLRKLIAGAVGLVGLGSVAGFALMQNLRVRAVEQRAEEQRLKAKQAIDAILRDVGRAQQPAEEITPAPTGASG